MKWVSAGSFFWTSAKCLQMSSVLQCVYQGGLASLLPNPSKFAGVALSGILICLTKDPEFSPWRYGHNRLTELPIEQHFSYLRQQSPNSQLTSQKFLASSVQSVSEEGYFCGPFSMAMLNYRGYTYYLQDLHVAFTCTLTLQVPLTNGVLPHDFSTLPPFLGGHRSIPAPQVEIAGRSLPSTVLPHRRLRSLLFRSGIG